jgi:hypothetical protein
MRFVDRTIHELEGLYTALAGHPTYAGAIVVVTPARLAALADAVAELRRVQKDRARADGPRELTTTEATG